jgi:hypothetical protein
VHQVELIGAEQMQPEASALEDQIVAEVELVNENCEARHARHDRRADGAVDDQGVVLAAALAGDSHHGRGEIAQQLVDFIQLHWPNI